ncbi:MAG: tetratricopeptide repeat protein [Elusimicrobia bacterium]|nr:tetratricopeptide repeat protein [Elusimicrobiota bacterium]
MRIMTIVAALIIHAAFSCVGFAQSHDEHFPALWLEAAQAYKDGDFSKAAEFYQHAAQEHPALWETHYNAANAHFRANSYPEALEYYWRAFELNPRNPNIVKNLNLAAQKTGDVFAPPGVPVGLYLVWHVLTKTEWVALSLICWWLLALALIAAKFRIGLKMTDTVRQGLWALSATLALTSAIAASHVLAGRREWAVIKVPGLLRSGPSENLPVTVQIPEGRFVRILEKKDAWTLIETRKEKLRGWLR